MKKPLNRKEVLHLMELHSQSVISRRQFDDALQRLIRGQLDSRDLRAIEQGQFPFTHRLTGEQMEVALRFHKCFSGIFRATRLGYINGDRQWQPLPIPDPHALTSNGQGPDELRHPLLTLVDPRVFWHDVGIETICRYAGVEYAARKNIFTENYREGSLPHEPYWLYCQPGNLYQNRIPLDYKSYLYNVQSPLTWYEGVCLFACHPGCCPKRAMDLPGSTVFDNSQEIACLSPSATGWMLYPRDGRKAQPLAGLATHLGKLKTH